MMEKDSETPGPTDYFGMGRTEINLNASYKFDRQKRVLPGEIYQMKPDYNNVLFHKDKGKSIKPELKGCKFPEAEPHEYAPVYIDPKMVYFPGPGAYQNPNTMMDKVTVAEKAPKFTMGNRGTGGLISKD